MGGQRSRRRSLHAREWFGDFNGQLLGPVVSYSWGADNDRATGAHRRRRWRFSGRATDYSDFGIYFDAEALRRQCT